MVDMSLTRTLLFVSTLFALSAVVASGAGVPIDSGNVEEKVVRSPDVWLVEFQSPRCGSCQEMAPVWNEFASRNGKYVRLGQVSIDTDEGMELAQRFGVIEHGIPSIWAYDLVGAVEPTKIWADFETTSVDHLESLVWSRYAKPEKGFLLAKPGAKASRVDDA